MLNARVGAAPELHRPAPRPIRGTCISFSVCPGAVYSKLRNVRADDLETFLVFSDGLSPASRESFRPYPWDNKDRLLPALHTAISQAVTGVDACYLMFHEDSRSASFSCGKRAATRTRASTELKCPNWG